MTGQYSAWTEGTPIGEEMLDVAAAIFAFDGIVQNPDRRTANPNCIVRGSNIRIFDHELCFSHGLVIGWQAPWVLGGLATLEQAGNHIFRSGLRRRGIDMAPIEAAWLRIADQRLAQYLACIPEEWSAAISAAQAAIDLAAAARDNIQGCIEEIKRVLS